MQCNLSPAEPDALIALVRISGGRRPACEPGSPIPEAASNLYVSQKRNDLKIITDQALS